MATRPPSSPNSRSKSVTVAPGFAVRSSPLTAIEIVVCIRYPLTRRRHARLGAQLKTQLPSGISMQRFDEQRRVGADQPRHIEFELGMSEWSGFRRIL